MDPFTLFGLVFFSALVALFAQSRGRSAALAFFVSIMISPLLSFVVYVLIGKKKETTV